MQDSIEYYQPHGVESTDPCSSIIARLKAQALALLSLSSLSPSLVIAGDSTEVGVLVEHIELGSSDASRLLRGYDGDGSALRERLQRMVEDQDAQLLETAYVRTRARGSSRIGSTREFLYPTEYEAPERPLRVTGKIAPGVDLTIPSSPAAFDLRDLGNRLTIGTEVYSGEDLITLDIASQLVEHAGDSSFGEGAAVAVQPIFDAMNSNSKVFVSSGRFALLGAHTPRLEGRVERDRAKRVLVMARATILKRGADPPRRVGSAFTDDPFGAGGEVEVGDSVSQVGVLVESIQLGAETATRLVRKHAKDSDAGAFREHVEGLIEGGEADLLDSSYLLITNGQRARIESIHELIYPTEYDPPGPPSSFIPIDPADGFPITPAPAQAFDVRDVGSRFEVEAAWGAERKRIRLNVAPERVGLVDFVRYGTGELLTQQPLFSVMKLQSNLILPDGGYALAAMGVPHDGSEEGAGAVRPDHTKRVLVFLKASLMRLPLTNIGHGEDHGED